MTFKSPWNKCLVHKAIVSYISFIYFDKHSSIFYLFDFSILDSWNKYNHTIYDPCCLAFFIWYIFVKFQLFGRCINGSFLFVREHYSIILVYHISIVSGLTYIPTNNVNGSSLSLPRSFQYVIFVLIMGILTGINLIFISVSFPAKDMNIFSMYLLAFCISGEKYKFNSLACLLIWLFVLLLFNFLSWVLCIFCILNCCQMYSWQRFYPILWSFYFLLSYFCCCA